MFADIFHNRLKFDIRIKDKKMSQFYYAQLNISESIRLNSDNSFTDSLPKCAFRVIILSTFITDSTLKFFSLLSFTIISLKEKSDGTTELMAETTKATVKYHFCANTKSKICYYIGYIMF